MDWLLDLPWADVAAFCAAWIGLITLVTMLGSRIPLIRKVIVWIGAGFQDLLGVTALRDCMERRFSKVEAAIVNLQESAHQTQYEARTTGQAVSDLATKIGNGGS